LPAEPGIADDPSDLLVWVLKWCLSWRIIHNPVKPIKEALPARQPSRLQRHPFAPWLCTAAA
tara:strand:- start:2889 stop:3074 length:186 start_codon:yes stop_codon:yes gene_type:complete